MRNSFFETNEDGPITTYPPVDSRALWPLVADRFDDNEEQFLQMCRQASQNDALVAGSVPMVGNDHNLIHGPGTFCWDMRLMKLMDIKRKDPNDINENMTLGQAIGRLRSLHSTLYKVFGINWLQLIQGSQDAEKVEQYRASLENRGPMLPLLSIFDENDLNINRSWAGEGPYLAGDEESSIYNLLIDLKVGTSTKGLLFVTGQRDFLRFAKVQNCPGIFYPQDLVPDENRLRLNIQNRKITIGSVATPEDSSSRSSRSTSSGPSRARDSSSSSSSVFSSSRGSSSQSEARTSSGRDNAEAEFPDVGQGMEADEADEAHTSEQTWYTAQGASSARSTSSPSPSRSRRKTKSRSGLTPDQGPRRSLRVRRLKQKAKKLSGGSHDERSLLDASLSAYDNASR